MSTERWRPRIKYWSEKYGADPVLVDCIMQIESGGNEKAIGPVNSNGTRDYGLMQLNPKGALASWTANGKPARDPMNPEHAIEIGCWFVGKCIPAWLKSLGQPVNRRNTIVSYNAGAGAVKSGKIPASTLSYLAKVEQRYALSTFRPDATATAVTLPPVVVTATPDEGAEARSGTSSGKWKLVGLAVAALWSAGRLLKSMIAKAD